MVLELFELVKDDWDQYDAMNLQHQCKLRTSYHFIKEDKMLIMKKKSKLLQKRMRGRSKVKR